MIRASGEVMPLFLYIYIRNWIRRASHVHQSASTMAVICRIHFTLMTSCINHQLWWRSFLCIQKAWMMLHATCMTETNYISVQLCSYPIHLSLWSLCQHLQNNVQIFLEFWTNTQCNVSKHRENLRFHWPMNCAILKNKDTKLYLPQKILWDKLHNLNILASITDFEGTLCHKIKWYR